MSHCTCDYHQEQNKTDYSHAHLIPSHSNEGQLGEDCGCDVHSSCSLHEEKDREELDYEDELVDYGMERGLARKFVSMQKANLKSFLSEKLKEEREKVEEFYMNQKANDHDNLIREALKAELIRDLLFAGLDNNDLRKGLTKAIEIIKNK